jgi:50S ribosomal subunit-associated GTPase HflX
VAARTIVTTVDPLNLWRSGKLSEVVAQIDAVRSEVDSVLVNVPYMPATQHVLLRQHLRTPVIDRYLLILHIFKAFARSPLARLHTQLAELPYLR